MKKSFQKHNKAVRIAFFTLLATLSTFVGLSTTLAKYVTDFTFEGNAMVAKFDVGIDMDSDSKQLFSDVYDLEHTGHGYTHTDSEFWANPVEEETADVAEGRIAPGVWGRIEIGAVNNSEVAVEYEGSITALSGYEFTIAQIAAKVDSTTTGKMLEAELLAYTGEADLATVISAHGTEKIYIPLKFCIENPENPSSWNNIADFLSSSSVCTGQLPASSTTANNPDYIYWKWDFETGTGSTLTENNRKDTIIGLSAAKGLFLDVTADLEVSFTQIDAIRTT